MAPLLRHILGRITGNFPSEEVARRVQARADYASGDHLFVPGGSQVVFYDQQLNVVEEERALYELHLRKDGVLEWKRVGSNQNEKCTFSAGGYSRSRDGYFHEWSHEEWADFPYNLTRKSITDLLDEPHSGCSQAFRWISTDWPTRYRTFLSTHRGSLDECERVFLWLAHLFASDRPLWTKASWRVFVKQSDDEHPSPALWSHTKRDCELLFDDKPVEFSDNQLKLIRLVHCYFQPFYLEEERRRSAHVYSLCKEQGIPWRFEVPPASFHERLEASLSLREWLQGKVSPQEIPVLLGEQ